MHCKPLGSKPFCQASSPQNAPWFLQALLLSLCLLPLVTCFYLRLHMHASEVRLPLCMPWKYCNLYSIEHRVMTCSGNIMMMQHDLCSMHFSIGRTVGTFAHTLVAVTILGSGISQVVASANSQQIILPEYNKREWTLILGGPILVFGLLPSFRSVQSLFMSDTGF